MKLLDYLFVCFVLMVSLTPLLPLRGWQGYGPAGEFYYTGELLHLRYNDPGFGNDKPHVFIVEAGRPASLIEFSDHHSYADRFNLYKNFTVKTRLENGVLKAVYSSHSISLVKTVKPLRDGVKVVYIFNRTVAFRLTLWRWYFTSVGPFNIPMTRSLTPSNTINFSVAESGKIYHAQLLLEPKPDNVTVSGVLGGGLNKLTIDFKSENVSVEVKLLNPQNFNVFFALDLRESKYLYPIIAVAASSVYLRLKRMVREGCVNEG
ncbi:MAG: hypothetical protein QXR81_08210 [Candidatus Nezhaarchaeales archaeon]